MTKKPSPVSRSVYQKLAEENKRLKADIRDLVRHTKRYHEVFGRWKKKFDQTKALDDAFRELLKKR